MDEFAYRENRPVLSAGEAILWQGKPKKGAFIATKSLTMMPFALLWLAFDSMFLIGSLQTGQMRGFVLIFLMIHMMPVWIWLANVITAGRRWKNTTYYVTNRRIILQDGFLAVNETSLFYKDLRNAQMRIGLLDKLFHTGDIALDDGTQVYRKGRYYAQTKLMEDLSNPQEVYHRIQKIILDIQTDIEYPNAYRPSENPGYQTEYRP